MLAAGVVTPLEIVFYALSIAAIIGGGTVGAFKFASNLGRDRAINAETLEVVKQLKYDVKDLHDCVDRRFGEVNRRIDQIPGGKP